MADLRWPALAATGPTAGAGLPTGTLAAMLAATAPAGWLALDGSTIGAEGSAADHAGTSYAALYTLLYAALGDAQAPVVGGRGTDATADWTAGKPLTLPDARGRTVIGAGTGPGLTERVTGVVGGAETVALGQTQLPAHTHGPGNLTSFITYGGPGGGVGLAGGTEHYSAAGSTAAAGSDEAHANMPPFLAATWFIKL